MKKTKFIFISLMLLSAFIVNAHSLYLFNIDLDFDKELKSNAVKSAQRFLKTEKEPLSFDLDKGLIAVQFEPDNRNYVEVNPFDYQIYGMRNENLKHKTEGNKLTKEQGYEIANKFFDALTEKIKSELKYDSEVLEVDGTYFYKWFRYVNGVLVVGEDFFVNVDAFNGNIISWRLPIFDYPKNLIETSPSISKNVAKRVSELSFNAPSAENFEPYLIVYGKELAWVTKLQGQFYPFYLGVSAYDGSISFTGIIPGEVPANYNIGDEIPVVENEITKQIYESK